MSEISYERKLHQRRFMTSVSLLRLGGISLNVKPLSSVSRLYNVVCVLCAYITLMCVIMDTLVSRRDLVQAMKKLRMTVGMTLAVWIHFSLSYCQRNIEHLLRLTDSFTWEELPNRDPDTGILTKAGYIPIIQRKTNQFLIFVMSFHVIQTSFRVLFNNDMIITSWFPVDISRTEIYVLANIMQGISSVFTITIYVGFPSLYATLVCVACSQLEKLGAALLNIRQTCMTSGLDYRDDAADQGSERQNHSSELLLRRMREQLNECIRHHQDIKRFMALLEDAMNLPLCGLFLLLLTSMCLVAFSLITSLGDYTDALQALVGYILLTSCLCTVCWLGNELTTHAEALGDSAWSCDWVGSPVPFQRCLVFIIAVAKKEFTLTAGKFVPVGNATMMNMINQSISFFMFLLHMKDKTTDSEEKF